MIKKCFRSECVSKFQDERYGKKMRVYNKTTTDKLRCTVCGNEIETKKY